jgi:hypothetical protein
MTTLIDIITMWYLMIFAKGNKLYGSNINRFNLNIIFSLLTAF